ncbi:hypothetical protein ACROYT_G014541 [Oculina patagonica]
MKPSTYASEIQNRLLLDGVIHPNDLPGTSQINRRLTQDLMFSKKKLTVCPLEAEKPGAVDQQDEYLQAISRYSASKIHFFNESSVIKTTGNRCYGNARIKQFLQLHQLLAMNETVVAIGEAICHITAENSAGYFRSVAILYKSVTTFEAKQEDEKSTFSVLNKQTDRNPPITAYQINLKKSSKGRASGL